jgi:hypothetical protein
MTGLIKYDAARRALAEACRIDEVKDIRDKAKAMQVYAQQAKDRDLIEHATEMRMRAEIRAGELLREMAERKERHDGKNLNGKTVLGSPRATPEGAPKLSDLGVTKTQSSRWQRLAALSPERQEEKIETAKRKAEAAVEPQKPKRKPVSNDNIGGRLRINCNRGNDESLEASADKRKARSDEGLSLPPIDNLVTKDKHNNFEATPWFASRIKPIFEGAIKNDAAQSAAALSQLEAACATLLPQMTIDSLQTVPRFLEVVGYAIVEAEDAAATAKRIKWEAKNPAKAKEKAREEARSLTMENEYDEAKAEARENGETWSDVKDKWIEQWIEDHGNEKEEAEFEARFQERWKKDHGKPWGAA